MRPTRQVEQRPVGAILIVTTIERRFQAGAHCAIVQDRRDRGENAGAAHAKMPE